MSGGSRSRHGQTIKHPLVFIAVQRQRVYVPDTFNLFSFEGFTLRWFQLIPPLCHPHSACDTPLSRIFCYYNCFINGKNNNSVSPNCCWWISPSATFKTAPAHQHLKGRRASFSSAGFVFLFPRTPFVRRIYSAGDTQYNYKQKRLSFVLLSLGCATSLSFDLDDIFLQNSRNLSLIWRVLIVDKTRQSLWWHRNGTRGPVQWLLAWSRWDLSAWIPIGKRLMRKIIITRRLHWQPEEEGMVAGSGATSSNLSSLGCWAAVPCQPITRANCWSICRLLNLSQTWLISY